jgi:ketosteroid isomerase-like protein
MRGRANIRRYLREIDERFDEWMTVMEDWRDAGDFVAALGHVHLHGRRSGVAFDQPLGFLLSSQGGSCLASRPSLTSPPTT